MPITSHRLKNLAALGICLCTWAGAEAAERYVDRSNLLPESPFLSWAAAATNIQDAVDAADPGDTIWVTNGFYDGGYGLVNVDSTTRVAVTKALTLRSVNGPAVTTISGEDPIGRIRCVYLTNGAQLIGFTLQNGAAQIFSGPNFQKSGGGIYSEPGAIVSNCVVIGGYAVSLGGGACGSGTYFDTQFISNNANHGGGACSGTFYRCSFSNNSATWWGGGSRAGNLFDCRLDNNRAREGGGAYQAELTNCWLAGNSATNLGGGATRSVLDNCTLTRNSCLDVGGGLTYSFFKACSLYDNTATTNGGGAYGCTGLYSAITYNQAYDGGGVCRGAYSNCLFTYNWVNRYGGGALDSELYHCTMSTNTGNSGGGGARNGTVQNCIAYYNRGGTDVSRNLSGATVSYSCSTPLAAGEGNVTNAPLFVDPVGGDYHLQPESLCIDGGLPAATGAPDKDGIPRPLDGNHDGVAVADMGCYEYVHPAADSDGDRIRDVDEFYCDTDPVDPASYFHATEPLSPAEAGIEVRWNGTSRRTYRVERSTNLLGPDFEVVASNLEGNAAGSYMDEIPPLDSPTLFYRILTE